MSAGGIEEAGWWVLDAKSVDEAQTQSRPRDFGPEDTDAPPPLPLVEGPVMDRLQMWAEQVQGDIALADAKASTLLGWSGTALAVVSSVLVSTGLSLRPVAGWVTPVGLAGLACLTWSVIALVLVIRPRLGGRLGGYTYSTDDRGFLAFANVPASSMLATARADAQPAADPTAAVQRVQMLARIAAAKHLLIRQACTLLLLSLPLLALAGTAMAASVSGGGA